MKHTRLAVLLCSLLGLTSCGGMTSSLYATADAARYDAIAPEHAGYVRTDASKSDEQKRRRFDLLATWKLAIHAAGAKTTAAIPEVDAVVPR